MVELINQNWSLITSIIGFISAFFGWIFGRKSRQLDLHKKAFAINSEMIDSIREDFDERIKSLQEYIKSLLDIIKSKDQIISSQQKIIEKQQIELLVYEKKYNIS